METIILANEQKEFELLKQMLEEEWHEILAVETGDDKFVVSLFEKEEFIFTQKDIIQKVKALLEEEKENHHIDFV